MTSHIGRVYAVAGALVVLFLGWAAVAAHPWDAAAGRSASGGAERAPRQVRQDAADAKRVVAARWERYEASRWPSGVERSTGRGIAESAPRPRTGDVSPWPGAHRPVIVRTVYARPGAAGSAPAYSAPSGSGGGYAALRPSSPAAPRPPRPRAAAAAGRERRRRGAGHRERVVVIRRRRFRAMGTEVELLVESDSDAESRGRASGRRSGRSAAWRGSSRASAPTRELSRLNREEHDRRRARAGRGRGARARRPGEHRRAVRPDRSRRRGGGGLRPLVRADGPDDVAGPTIARPRCGCGGGVHLDRARSRRSRLDPDVRLDLGGIAKGYCADRVRRGALGGGALSGQHRRRSGRPGCPG